MLIKKSTVPSRSSTVSKEAPNVIEFADIGDLADDFAIDRATIPLSRVFDTESRERPQIATAAPSASSRSAMARPMPRVPPGYHRDFAGESLQT